MPRPLELLERTDPITADFTYIRWLGDRKSIEEQTNTWNKTIVDRRGNLNEWVDACRTFSQRRVMIFGFANNHYAGYAPSTVELFRELWDKQGSEG